MSILIIKIAVVVDAIVTWSSNLTLVKRDFSGKMGFNEFKELWGALNQWKVSQGERMFCFLKLVEVYSRGNNLISDV